MLRPIKHRSAEPATSSVADIAFLLLSFFLMTTVIGEDQGLRMVLPEWTEKPIPVTLHERNVFSIHINSNDQLMIEREVGSPERLKSRIKEFLLNNGRIDNLSESPAKAIVALKTDRGASHSTFINVLDEIQGAYYEIYAQRLGITVEQYRKLRLDDPEDRKLITRAHAGFPMAISLSEPMRFD